MMKAGQNRVKRTQKKEHREEGMNNSPLCPQTLESNPERMEPVVGDAVGIVVGTLVGELEGMPVPHIRGSK